MSQLQTVKQAALELILKVEKIEQLEEIEKQIFGRNGLFSQAIKEVKSLDGDAKREFGIEMNEAKSAILKQLDKQKANLMADLEKQAIEPIDVTIPGKKIAVGALSVLTQTWYEIEDIFRTMGWGIWEGPELMSEYQVFDVCNFEKDHPAREIMDTFWIDPVKDAAGNLIDSKDRRLPRPHLSGIQNLLMKEFKPPFRFIYPGRNVRYEPVDARHHYVHHQVEGLLVGKGVSMANYKAMFKEILSKLFLRDDVEVRMRAGYFPFVEPGFEIDFRCLICDGAGCSACKHVGWIEIAPGGMVHPNVFRIAGLNPEEWNGFAFAIGIERIAMMKHKIDDIRRFTDGDLRFETQFI